MVYGSKDWFFASYDGRKKAFRGISRQDFNKARDLHVLRSCNRPHTLPSRVENFKRAMAWFATIPYACQGDGLDDFSKYQRPARDGKGYVAICPGEPANNVYVDDPFIVRALTRKYHEHMGE